MAGKGILGSALVSFLAFAMAAGGCAAEPAEENASQSGSDLSQAAPCGGLKPNQSLAPGQSVKSCDGRFLFVLQGDGNLVLYMGQTALWSSATGGQPSKAAVMQGDGNLVVYDAAGHALWHTMTGGHPGAGLAVQNDGNLVIYGTGGNVLWTSNTGGHGAGGPPAQCVDTLDFFLPKENNLALAGPLTQVFTGTRDSGSKFHVKWSSDFYEYYVWNKDTIYLNFDSTNGLDQSPYSFSPGPWMPRWWCVGQSLPVFTNIVYWSRNHSGVQALDTWTCAPTNILPTGYTMQFMSHGPVDMGGDIGVEDAIVVRYARGFGWEDFTFGAKHGWLKWQESGGQQAIFNKLSNTPIQPKAAANCRP